MAGPDTFVPVEHRIGGLDRRTVLPALVVLMIAAVFAIVLPSINNAVSYHDETKAGDVLDLVGGELTMTPTVGWNIITGVRLVRGSSEAGSTSTTELALDDVTFTVKASPFAGTPNALLTQVNHIDSKLGDRPNLGSPSARSNIATDDGTTGVAEFYTGLQVQGFNAAFVYTITGAQVGIEIVVRGSDDSLTRRIRDVGSMVRSIRLKQGATS